MSDNSYGGSGSHDARRDERERLAALARTSMSKPRPIVTGCTSVAHNQFDCAHSNLPHHRWCRACIAALPIEDPM